MIRRASRWLLAVMVAGGLMLGGEARAISGSDLEGVSPLWLAVVLPTAIVVGGLSFGIMAADMNDGYAVADTGVPGGGELLTVPFGGQAEPSKVMRLSAWDETLPAGLRLRGGWRYRRDRFRAAMDDDRVRTRVVRQEVVLGAGVDGVADVGLRVPYERVLVLAPGETSSSSASRLGDIELTARTAPLREIAARWRGQDEGAREGRRIDAALYATGRLPTGGDRDLLRSALELEAGAAVSAHLLRHGFPAEFLALGPRRPVGVDEVITAHANVGYRWREGGRAVRPELFDTRDALRYRAGLSSVILGPRLTAYWSGEVPSGRPRHVGRIGWAMQGRLFSPLYFEIGGSQVVLDDGYRDMGFRDVSQRQLWMGFGVSL